MTALVALDGVSFGYPREEFRLRVERVAVEPGEAVACIGPSGAGKTTLLELMAGIRIADSGRVCFEGDDWRSLGDARRRRVRASRLGLVFQELDLLEHLTVRENVLLPALLFEGGPSREHEDRARELARSVEVDALLARKPRTLSHGERQRVAICRALLLQPSLVLADEPVGNLDARTSTRVLELLRAEAAAAGAAIVVVTHDLTRLGDFDRVIDMEDL